MHKEEYDLEDTQKFLSNESNDPSSVKIVGLDSKQPYRPPAFSGLSKEEILKYGSDPLWVKVRWALFILFWLAWFGMLTIAILIVVLTPKCAYRPKQEWWDKEVVYQLDVAAFKDSDGDGKGDLNGLIEKLDYFETVGARVLCLRENLLDEGNVRAVRAGFGDEQALKTLKKELETRDMHLIIDIPASALTKDDEEILKYWLNNYADGIRIVQMEEWQLDADEKIKKLNSWIKVGNDIWQKTYRPKMVIFYPYEMKEKNSPEPQLVIDASLLKINDADLNNQATFASKLNFNNATSYIIDDFKSKRIRDSLPNTNYLSIYHGLVLLLKGTPFILYGDELEFNKSDKTMIWDNTPPACGFTTSNTTTSSSSSKCSKSVKHSLSHGSGDTLLKLYQNLVKLRLKEPSFNWGKLDTSNNNDDKVNVISYVREADRFDGFLVCANLDKDKHLVDFKARHSIPNEASVEFYYAASGMKSEDFTAKAKIRVDNVQLKSGDFLVLRFTRQVVESDTDEASSGSAGHG